jgi:DNA transformation protein and related proteins
MSSKQDEFRDYCLELFSGLRQGEIVTKKMFGGTGFSIDTKTFGIIAFDQLWLKVDDETRADFVNAKCQIFTHESARKERTMNYHTVPEDAMESATLMRPWALLAWGAALRAAAMKNAKAPKITKATKSVKTQKVSPSVVAKKTTPKTKK